MIDINEKAATIIGYQEKHRTLLDMLEDTLSEKRLQHSIRVAEVAYDLALISEVDRESAYLAGIAHDLCRESNLPEIFNLAQKSTDNNIVGEMANLYLQDITEENAMLVHGLAATTCLFQRYPLSQKIYWAIASHTIGHPKPNVLQKLLFIADRIEIERTIWSMQERTDLFALTNLDSILLRVIDKILATYSDVHAIVTTMRVQILEDIKNEK